MDQLQISSVKNWTNQQLPATISTRCGYCRNNEFFRIDEWPQHGSMRYAGASCPGCSKFIHFVVTGYRNSQAHLGGGELFVHPSSAGKKASQELISAFNSASAELAADYDKAVHYLNLGDFGSVVLASRRMLEGLTSHFLKDKNKGHLATDLVALTKERDLSDILEKLSLTLKNAGNMGAHYGASRVTAEIAESSLSLAEDLMKLHFLLQSRVEDVERLVEQAQKTPISVATAEPLQPAVESQ